MTYQTPEESARDLMSYMRDMYGQQHIFRKVDSKDFRNVNQKFYRRSQSTLEALGFRYLIDIEDTTLNEVENAHKNKPKTKKPFIASLSSWWRFLSQPIFIIPKCNTNTFIRLMISDDHASIAGIYHFPTSSWWIRFLQFLRCYPQGIFTIDFETEFSDGTFLITGNTQEMSFMTDIPGIHRQLLPAQTSIEKSLVQHRQVLQHMESGDTEANLVNSWPEVEAMQQRLQEILNGHRQSVGYITGEDVERIANGRYDKATTIMKDEIEKLRRGE